MFSWLGNAWRVPELRRRVLFTAIILALYRLGSWMPAPGVDSDTISSYFNGQGGTVLGLLNLFSGSALSPLTVDLAHRSSPPNAPRAEAAAADPRFGIAVTSVCPTLMMSCALALSTDYSLFLLTRLKAEARTAERLDAVAYMLYFSGHVILVSGGALTLPLPRRRR